MGRLTNKKEADAQRLDYENRLKNGYPRSIPEERYLKLAAYEDTGLTPEEIMGLKEPPNAPLTMEELQEMAWKQTPVWCRDADGIHAGLLCIRDDWYTSERMSHIWILDEEGNSGVYSVKSLIQAGATFYRRRPEGGSA